MESQQFNTFPGLRSWFTQKELSTEDVQFISGYLSLLKTTGDVEEFNRVTHSFLDSRPSLSDTQMAIELIVDLILLKKMNHVASFDSMNSSDRKVKQQLWMQELRNQRFSETAKNDAEREAKIRALAWPSQAKLKIERRGDRHGVEVRFFVASAIELKKTLAALERVQNDFPV